jgi:hypothetical protein
MIGRTAECQQLAGHDNRDIAILKRRIVFEFVEIESRQREQFDRDRLGKRTQTVQQRDVELRIDERIPNK